jgi:hypothetical protein
MRNFKIMAIVVFSLLVLACNGNANDKKSKSKSVKNRIEVIDFHSTHRCVTCRAIEANTRYTLNTYFAEQMKKGIITFQTVNVDLEKNYKKAEKFEASGTSLFLNVVLNGKENIINITKLAFAKGRDQKVFAKELKKIIEKQLKKL